MVALADSAGVHIIGDDELVPVIQSVVDARQTHPDGPVAWLGRANGGEA